MSEKEQKTAMPAPRWPGEPDHGRTRLYLARHGELVTSQEWRFVGHMDVPLNDAGITQMQRLGQRLNNEKIDLLLSSDLQRTVHSARIIGDFIGLSPVQHRDFREIHLGRWEGMTREEIAALFPGELEKRSGDLAGFTIEGGESFTDVKKRVVPLLEQYVQSYRGKNILLVAHGGVNRVILCHALGLDLGSLVRIDQTYGCLNIIDYFNGEPVISLMNGIF